MQQTILAMLAIMLVGTFSLTQHRGTIKMYDEIVDDELEIAASGVAMHIMELISNRAFDARTMPYEINQKGMPVGSDEFTSTSAFGRVGTMCDLDEPFKDVTPCTDLDDAHMAPGEWQAVPFRLKDGKELGFDVRVEVYYVDPSDLDTPLPAGQVSFHKKVVVYLRANRHVRQNRYVNGFVRLERIFSFDTKRAEFRTKEEYPDSSPSQNPPNNNPPEDGGGDNNGADIYDENEVAEADPDRRVWVCHRSIEDGKISWRSKVIRQKFLEKHVGHGDTAGKC